MTTADVIEAIRRRHPALSEGVPGEWTVLCEWRGIDVLAWRCWGDARRIGYEVKVSRADMRRELLKPGKRAIGMSWCHEFYFAVPEGLYKPAELAFEEPEDWTPEDFERERCTGMAGVGRRDVGYDRRHRYGGFCGRISWDPEMRAKRTVRMPRPAVLVPRESWGEHDTLERRVRDAFHEQATEYVLCQECQGRGYRELSRVEREAPTLWVPRDVGLMVVRPDGSTRVLRKAPRREPTAKVNDKALGELVRWVSVRPDPRHRRDNDREADSRAA